MAVPTDRLGLKNQPKSQTSQLVYMVMHKKSEDGKVGERC